MLEVVEILHQGGVIAYPTEAVYGLGCDPFNHAAVQKLLRLKQREESKGVILVASSWDQVSPLVRDVPKALLNKALATWPGPVTWVFPASEKVPRWICKGRDSVAIRLSAHPIVQSICQAFASPIVSTSANLAGHAPAKTATSVRAQFPSGIDLIVEGEVGALDKPTPIYDVMTGREIRGC